MKPFFLIFAILLLVGHPLRAEDEPQPVKRVRVISLPIQLSNRVGGHYVDSYVVHLNQGQRVHVQVENETDNSRVYFDAVVKGTETRFGSDESENSWSG